MDIKKEEREYSFVVSYDVSKLDVEVRKSLKEKFTLIDLDQFFDEGNVKNTLGIKANSITYKKIHPKLPMFVIQFHFA
jgi:hypothetical protein